jgi:hypothetical protein
MSSDSRTNHANECLEFQDQVSLSEDICEICLKDISHYTVNQKKLHYECCLNDQLPTDIRKISKLCPICNENLPSKTQLKPFINHLKKCCKKSKMELSKVFEKLVSDKTVIKPLKQANLNSYFVEPKSIQKSINTVSKPSKITFTEKFKSNDDDDDDFSQIQKIRTVQSTPISKTFKTNAAIMKNDEELQTAMLLSLSNASIEKKKREYSCKVLTVEEAMSDIKSNILEYLDKYKSASKPSGNIIESNGLWSLSRKKYLNDSEYYSEFMNKSDVSLFLVLLTYLLDRSKFLKNSLNLLKKI